MANISLDYLVTCAPTQVHTHQQSSIILPPLKEFPPALRLIREDGSIFYINLMECSTCFDSLIRIHHIYSCWLKRHINAEKCGFYDAETDEALIAGSRPAVLYKARAYGVCTTVMVVLNTQRIPRHEQNHENEAYFIEPDTDTRAWVRMSKRFIDVETLDAFNLPWEEDTNNSTMIIIKTYLNIDFTEVLFEHTRRSRRMREEDEVREVSDNEAEDHKSECLKTSRATKLTKLPQLKEFANRSSSLLELSGEIRAGIQTDTSRLSLLTAHVDCFKELCRAISHLCCFIQHALLVKFQGIGTRSDQPDSETLDQSSDLDKANEHIPVAGYSNADIPEASNMTRYTGEDREISWHISPQSTGTAGTLGDRIYAPSYRVPSPIASILGNRNMGDTSLSRRQRTDPRERAWDDSESSKSDLEDHKISLAYGCQALKKAEDYVIESKYSIICTLIETNPLDIDDYIAVGPSRIVSSTSNISHSG
ncbi:hypothetical protein BDV34DRAFT_223141 [Aspergillus parasiticus]|uniref:Uncharacterized protein n=1 Tax=Aspergillus parasiticus TaxID=5067 RepID=A0A5N6DT24_ASPPA|nr:hypothetical protein BDV34DRAFT_223141 [Aspergillus parasiticus]